MSPFTRILAASAALAVSVVGTAMAQNYGLNPSYGILNLTTGFQPDPSVVNVQSGGTVNAQTLHASCAGFVAEAPDVRLNYTAGSLPLIISANAAADTTLVVNGPDGSWYCDDDSGVQGMNPMVRFNTPASGQYDIWIGTYANASLQPAQLHISELTSQ